MSVQLPSRETAELEDVALLGFALSVPAGSSLRLDQPCAREHGSVGGWRSDPDGEIAYTLLWRPLGYWRRAGTPDRADATDLQSGFVEQALASTRKDSRALTIEDRRSLRAAGHDGELVDTTIQVRRKVGRVALRRRQVLWTCRDTARHVAFEVSALADADDPVRPLFDDVLATVTCHGGAR